MADPTALIDRADKALQKIESGAINRIESAIDAAYRDLEKQILRKYPKYTAQSMPGLLATQRALLLINELKTLMPLFNPERAKLLKREFKELIKTANAEGVKLADSQIRSIAGDDFIRSTARIPIEAVTIAAEESYRRLERHGADFAGKASALITQGLIQGWGPQRIIPTLREQVGITKGRAQTIVRTETMAASNAAAAANYRANNILYFQAVATSDSRTCPICIGRNGNVYRIDEARIPWHFSCRCYGSPWRKEWKNSGLINNDWIAKFQKEVEQQGGKPDYDGLSPFEKLAGATKPPTPVWTPRNEQDSD